ncbi:tetratricopeptide repeat protein [Pseudooceanicola onchidii]|uniref:tetratricopeptide repeat protein n=1 Tax=Pseudooceanicola onchidii TaxID=2562279 RepID=UPI0010A9F605|nr:tetratricopeptide repeat protein [Pseudooceanicola onchidii]
MSQSDSFIDEVTEEVRRDRLFATFRRYGWIAAVVVVVIVAGAAWYEYTRAEREAQAEAFGDAILTALEQGEPGERAAALDAIGADTPDAAAMLGLTRAAEMARSGDTQGAVDELNRVAETGEVPVVYRSLAKFRALALQADTLSPAERRDGYQDLAGAGSPLRLLALEQIAMTHVEEGNPGEALAQLRDMQEDAGMTPDLLRRISQLIVVLGGTPGEADTTQDG